MIPKSNASEQQRNISPSNHGGPGLLGLPEICSSGRRQDMLFLKVLKDMGMCQQMKSTVIMAPHTASATSPITSKKKGKSAYGGRGYLQV
jgi:hypothetical protein